MHVGCGAVQGSEAGFKLGNICPAKMRSRKPARSRARRPRVLRPEALHSFGEPPGSSTRLLKDNLRGRTPHVSQKSVLSGGPGCQHGSSLLPPFVIVRTLNVCSWGTHRAGMSPLHLALCCRGSYCRVVTHSDLPARVFKGYVSRCEGSYCRVSTRVHMCQVEIDTVVRTAA